MIVANGCPKSGTHALMRLLSLQGKQRCPGILKAVSPHFGLTLNPTPADLNPITLSAARDFSNDYFIHGHVRVAAAVQWLTFVTVKRDPRNVLVSYVRWTRKERGTTDVPDLCEAMDRFFSHPFPKTYRAFLGWEKYGTVLRYEDIAEQCASIDIDLYANSTTNRDTWTSAPSDWRNWWSERIEKKWRQIGGPDLVAEAGYR